MMELSLFVANVDELMVVHRAVRQRDTAGVVSHSVPFTIESATAVAGRRRCRLNFFDNHEGIETVRD